MNASVETRSSFEMMRVVEPPAAVAYATLAKFCDSSLHGWNLQERA
jgi:hypothetical protein